MFAQARRDNRASIVTDKYTNFAELKQNETEDEDYAILYRGLDSNIAIMAPHGGGIEPGTIDIGDAIAGNDYTFYGFKGLKTSGNRVLHINSRNFDEPVALKAAHNADIVISIHGAKGKCEMVHVGGVHRELKQHMVDTLKFAGFDAVNSETPGLGGTKPDNLCNRCKTGQGVQLEISKGLRASLFDNFDHRSLRKKRTVFYKFVNTLQEVLIMFSGNT